MRAVWPPASPATFAVRTGAIAQRFLAPELEEEESEFAVVEQTNREILAELREVKQRLAALEGRP